MDITLLQHPIYKTSLPDWEKFRLTYEGGSAFIDRYLKKFSTREDDDDFRLRKCISYCSAFAKSGLMEIKNSIFQRITDISRLGGTKKYIDACLGINGGVDRRGKDMDSFIGLKVLEDLLVIGKIGVYVDRSPLPENATRAQTAASRPYVYAVKAEDIISWTESSESESEYVDLLLREELYKYDDTYGLVCDTVQRYRHVFIDDVDGKVHVVFYDQHGKQIDRAGNESSEEIVLNLTRIPFVPFQITGSLLTDIADYQIALMNLNSSDMNYGVRSNFPFYTEQADARSTFQAMLRGSQGDEGTGAEAATAKSEDVDLGAVSGRRYGKGLERPGFIHPSPEPLYASMEKEEQMKAEIRQLINLNVSNLSPRSASADSKAMDMSGLESGLSYIGIELERGERQIAEHWMAYEGSSEKVTIRYPKRYNIRTDEERQKEAEALGKQIAVVPSKTYQKAVAKKIARVVVGAEVTNDELLKIYKEIDASEAVIGDPEIIRGDVEAGLLSKKLGAKIRQYPEGDVDIAEHEHRDRILALAEAQAAKQGPAADAENPAARGNPDGSADPKKDAKDEKAKSRDTTDKDSTKPPVRGPGK